MARSCRCHRGRITAVGALAAACLTPSGLGSRVLRGHQVQNRSSYRQTLHNYQNVQYFADFQIGGQSMTGIFDTGSFELLVRSSRCEGCAHPTPPYDHAKSASYVKNGTVTRHVFGSGPCISMLGYETISVGPDLHASDQAFWEITSHRIQVLDTAKFAAIVGIGPNFAYGNQEKTLLMSYGVDEFSICLQRESNSPGFLTWGPEEEPLGADGLVSARVVGKHHWVTPMTNVTFEGPDGKNVANVCGPDAPCAAIVDSGTSLIAAPGLALMQLSEQLPPIHEDCSNLHELPTLRFNIDGHPLELPPQAYVMRITGATLEADSIWDVLFFKPKIRKLDMCMPAFMQMDMTSQFGPVWILGMPFFRYYHTTFDRQKKEMRFAHAGEACKPEPIKMNKTHGNGTQFLAVQRATDTVPMDVDVGGLIPPTLSEQMDFPFGNKGELDL